MTPSVLWAAFRSEWIKLRRRTLLFGTFGGLAAAASLFMVLVFTQAGVRNGGNDLPSLSQLAQPNGLIHGLDRAIVLLGIVAFGIAATQIASEYSLGTLRQLLVRQPRRAGLLSGKFLAVVSFLVCAVAFAALVALGVALLMAAARHVPVNAWFSSAGAGDLLRALGDLLLGVVGFATLGLVVGLFLRSSVFAVIIGFAYLLPVEALIVRIFPSTSRWLPGQLLQSVGSGGGEGSTFGRSLLISLLYLAVVSGAALVSFSRRDVTA
jgi:ABC-type transport system involved in multi-copper enzyme maturation permease subunit